MGHVTNGQLRVKINGNALSGLWSNQYATAKSNWNNYSGSRVRLTETDFDSSNLDVRTYSGSWPYGEYIKAFTTIFDAEGNSWNDGASQIPDCYRIGDIGYEIAYASVICNPNYEDGLDDTGFSDPANASTNRAKTLTHEIGHCFNLGHRPTDISVMNQGWSLEWDHYDRPQAIDRSDLQAYY